MRIKANQFCNLATSPSWQTWLYSYNSDIYSDFIHKLHSANGCSENRMIMTNVLRIIKENGDSSKLIQFLNKNYPNVVLYEPGDNELDYYFSTGVLTFPRRHIIEAPRSQLSQKVQEFISDKFKYDYLVVGRKAYIEYLTNDDIDICDDIPPHNWIIARQKNAEKTR